MGPARPPPALPHDGAGAAAGRRRAPGGNRVDSLSGSWTSDEVSASGQVFEFRLWAALTEQSRGLLHVFLPLSDRGVDALVHRLTDGDYIPVQAKARSSLVDGEVHLVVWADSLRDDDALLVSGLVVEGGLGPMLLVIREGDFKRLAEKSVNDGRPIYSARFGMNPRPGSRFADYVVAVEQLSSRFGLAPAAPFAAAPPFFEPEPMWRSDLGFLGESETVRLLAESGDLNVFHPFPDLETAEVVAMHLHSRRVVGIQVKTRGVDGLHPAATVNIRAASLRTSPTTYFVVLAWLREKGCFHDEMLFIPSEDLRRVCHPAETEGNLKFDWHPGSTAHTVLDPYRRPRTDLRTAVESLLA